MASHKQGKPPAPPAKPPAVRKKTAGVAVSVKRPKVDWDAVERDYRTGKFTTRELGSKHGVSHVAVAKKAKDNQWTQDLTEHIRQATNAKLTASLVNKEVNDGFQAVNTVVLAAAEINTNVILGHRQGLREITDVRRMLLLQVAQAAAQLPDLAEVIEMARNPDENGQDKLNDALKKALGRSALVDDLKKLSEVDERVRKGELQAFGIESGSGDSNPEGRQKRVVLEFVDVVPK